MHLKFSFANSLCIAAMTASMATATHAAALRTFVSGFGDDSNTSTNCSHAAPCRTFAVAVTVTSAGGEIEALDPAGYGPITITGPLTLVGLPGAAINAPSGANGITINTTAAAIITLRGLTLEGNNAGLHGIDLNSSLPNGAAGGTLNVINCVVKDFTNNGIFINPSFAGGAVPTLKVLIADSFFLNNGVGINVAPGTVNINSSIDRTVVSGNGTGIKLASSGAGVNTLLVDSHIDNNTTGISLSGNTGITMKSSTANFAGIGSYDILNGATVGLYDRNTIGLINNSGNGITDGTNNIGLLNGNALTKQNPQ